MLDQEWLQDEIDSTRRYLETLRERLAEAQALQAAGVSAEQDVPAVPVVETEQDTVATATEAGFVEVATVGAEQDLEHVVQTATAAVEVPVLDDSAHAVRLGWRVSPMGNTISYRLFALFFHNAGQWVGVEEMLDVAWEPGVVRSDEAVRSAVFRLRQVLTEDHMPELAEAIVARAGHYKLVPVWQNETPDETAGDDGSGTIGADDDEVPG